MGTTACRLPSFRNQEVVQTHELIFFTSSTYRPDANIKIFNFFFQLYYSIF